MNRRTFLKNTTIAATPLLIPVAFNPLGSLYMDSDSVRKLVLIHLNGGNDGFNTIVPYADTNYYNARPTIAVPVNDVIKLNENFGFNPALKSLKPHFDKGNMLIMNNVGCAHLDHSHYTSCKLWETASTDNTVSSSWTERSRQQSETNHLNQGVSDELTLTSDDFEYGLKKVAIAINGGSANQIYQVSLDGFDTHQFQKHKHDHLLNSYAEGLNAFLNELEAAGQLRDTLVVTWSEFGRQLKENTKKGTEHGNTNSMLIYGGSLKAKGIWNHSACLDFRSIYATITDRWLKASSISILNGEYPVMSWL